MNGLVKKIIVFAAVILFGLAGVAVVHFTRGADNAVVAVVNGESIQSGEFKLILTNNHVANTRSYFKQKYGADDSKDFWTKSFEGETPLDYARSKALEECVRIKIQQGLMKQYGIIDDTAYTAFLEGLDKENTRRKEAVKKGEVIYGPKEYREYDYYSYVLSNNIIKLKEKLEKDRLAVSKETLSNWYEKIKDEKYRLPDYIKIQEIEVGYNNGKITREQGVEKIGGARKMLDDGGSFEAAAAEYSTSGKVLEFVSDERSAKNDEEVFQHAWKTAGKLKAGEVSEIIDTGNSFLIIKCVERKGGKFQPYEQIADSVKTDYIDREYEKMIDEIVRGAKVELSDKVYKSILP